MGVIGQDTYNAIKSMTKEQMQFALADCGLSQQEIDQTWMRKEALQNSSETLLQRKSTTRGWKGAA